MKSLADVIVDYYDRKNIIPSDMKPMYTYGVSLIVNDILSFSTILILSAMISRFIEGIIFLCVFYFLRVRCGGFHAKKVWICRMTMAITFSMTMIATEIILHFNIQWLVIPMDILSICLLLIVCPVENPNKILTTDIKRKNKKIAIITILIFAILSSLAMVANIKQSVVISISMLAVAVLAVIGTIVNKIGGENDEQKIL